MCAREWRAAGAQVYVSPVPSIRPLSPGYIWRGRPGKNFPINRFLGMRRGGTPANATCPTPPATDRTSREGFICREQWHYFAHYLVFRLAWGVAEREGAERERGDQSVVKTTGTLTDTAPVQVSKMKTRYSMFRLAVPCDSAGAFEVEFRASRFPILGPCGRYHTMERLVPK